MMSLKNGGKKYKAQKQTKQKEIIKNMAG